MLADDGFPILGVDFLRFHSPDGGSPQQRSSGVDKTGRQFTIFAIVQPTFSIGDGQLCAAVLHKFGESIFRGGFRTG
jgi:hypothetical protein